MVENTIIFFKKASQKDSSLSFYIKTLQNKRRSTEENEWIGKIHEYIQFIQRNIK